MAGVRLKFAYIYCPICQYRGKGEPASGAGRIILEIILFLCFIIPWILFRLLVSKKYKCPKCGNTEPHILSPEKLRRCPYCDKVVTDDMPTCPQCGRVISSHEIYQQERPMKR